MRTDTCRWIGSREKSPFTRTRLGSGEAGFTLLEVLVAFAVLAVMIVPIPQVFGGGLGTTETARAYSTAALLARSKLAEVGVAETLSEGETTGSFDVPGYRWRRLISVDTSEVIPPEPEGVEEGMADITGNRQRRRGLGRGSAAERGEASPAGRRVGRSQRAPGGFTGRAGNIGGASEDLIAYNVTVTVEWANFRGGGALTLSTLRLGRMPNNQRTNLR